MMRAIMWPLRADNYIFEGGLGKYQKKKTTAIKASQINAKN